MNDVSEELAELERAAKVRREAELALDRVHKASVAAEVAVRTAVKEEQIAQALLIDALCAVHK